MNNKENIRILLTDDDQDDRDFFADAVQDIHLNFPVEFCQNGLELLKRLYDSSLFIPDIIFLDLNMPVMSGFETLKQIREDILFKHIPVIAIYSTSASEEGVKNTFRLGANAYVVKPTDFNDLKKLVKKVIQMDWKERLKHSKFESFIIAL
ncbi:response regulator [Flavobacterium chilense]|uniref:Response regulator receiver domain-containing protein n=1 Tax=Flavobacterium chilense TaxID=946677 RepID=A0A1M6ZZF0_9FLAO|nr:response regulator [Flavobacterium chilense]SHL35908.1 Response regulator receiver domain-containing protein [Flavobacterium chilense]